jgi:hypothetical protein
MGIVVLAAFDRALDSRLATLALPPEAVQALDAQRARLAEAEIPAGLDPAAAAGLRRAIDESFLDGFRLAMFVCASLALGGALSALAFIEGKGAPAGAGTARPPEPGAHRAAVPAGAGAIDPSDLMQRGPS